MGKSRFRVHWADEALRPKSDEEKRADLEGELAFRRGYYYGASDVIEALTSGTTARQLKAWIDNVIFYWWHHRVDINNWVDTPELPKPWEELRQEIFELKGKQCAYCGKEADQIDHIVPLARGGMDALDNLVPCCSSCNRSKRDRLLEEWKGPTELRSLWMSSKASGN